MRRAREGHLKRALKQTSAGCTSYQWLGPTLKKVRPQSTNACAWAYTLPSQTTNPIAHLSACRWCWFCETYSGNPDAEGAKCRTPLPLLFPGGGGSLGQPKIFRYGSLCCCVGDCVVGHCHLYPLHSWQDQCACTVVVRSPRGGGGGWGTVFPGVGNDKGGGVLRGPLCYNTTQNYLKWQKLSSAEHHAGHKQ